MQWTADVEKLKEPACVVALRCVQTAPAVNKLEISMTIGSLSSTFFSQRERRTLVRHLLARFNQNKHVKRHK